MNQGKLRRVVIKEELVELTGNWLCALILNQFLYWSERVDDFDCFLAEEQERDEAAREIDPRHGWIYKSSDQLVHELMECASSRTIRRRTAELVENGWLQERNNPKYKWDRTLQYRVDRNKLRRDLLKLGYTLEGYRVPLDTVSIGQDNVSNGKDSETLRSAPADEAIPKITIETTSKTTNDNGADAPAQSEPVQERKPTDKNALKKELEGFFIEVTGLPAPLLNTAKQRRAAGALFYAPLLEIAGWCDGDLDECKVVIGAAVTRLREINYTISSPKSILNVARAVYAERSNDGHRPHLSAAGTYGPVACAAGLGDVITADDFTPEELERCST